MTPDPAARPIHITLLGTGTSTGIPVIGCTCRVCTSTDPRDQRTRCACIVRVGDVHLLIDTGPDFRIQALQESIPRIDAVLYTHHHFDHVAGIDDLRPYFFQNRAALPCYARPNVATEMRRMFSYIFLDGSYPGVPQLTMHDVDAPFSIADRYGDAPPVLVDPVDVYHGTLPMYGFRIGRFAYLTDTSHIPEASFAKLQNLDVLVLSALRHTPHPTHFTFAEAVETAQRIGAQRTYFIHMTHNATHAAVEAELPKGIALGYDGLTLEIAP